MRSFVVAGLGLLAIAAAGCGETPVQPSPNATNVFLPALSGPWLGSLELASVTGGECVGQDLGRALATQGARDFGTVTLSQSGSQVTAVVRSIDTGSSCTYAGTTGINLFTLTDQSCDEKEVFFQCSNGDTRILNVISSTLSAIPQGATASGVVATSYNVSGVDAAGTRRPIAGLTVQYSFDAVRP